MRLFTVHLPMLAGSGQPALERAELVRDGFHPLAFLLGPFWCLWRGLWIAALAILVLSGALLAIGRLLHVSSGTQALAQIVLAFLVGLEAPNLRRIGLRRQGYVDGGIVAANDLTEAEAVFFARAAAPGQEAAAVSHAAQGRSLSVLGHGHEDVVGLFPEYRGR
jgi:hypothetical protein